MKTLERGRHRALPVACIIVHHKMYPDVLKTIDAIHSQGVPINQIVVVDNSEDEEIRQGLERASVDGFSVLFTDNRGYAAAVNAGARAMMERLDGVEYVLVSTHEVVPQDNALQALCNCLDQNPMAEVAGPTLLYQDGDLFRTWSTGGKLSKLFNLPGHHSWGSRPVETMREFSSVERQYLDGAFCLYRSDWITQHPLPEHYFLYFEETHYHTRIRRSGRKVLWCSDARVIQSSSGIPPYYLGRNLHLFQHEFGNRLQRRMSLMVAALQLLLKAKLKKRDRESFAEIWRGYQSAKSFVAKRRPENV